MTEQTASQIPEQKPEDIFEQRKAKIDEFSKAGLKPFGKRFDGAISTAEARALFVPDAETEPAVRIAGRMTAFRAMGKAVFADVKDSSGRMQIYVQRDTVGEDFFKLFKKFDIGDLIGVDGVLFQTRTGEITVKATACTLLSKSLRPLPEKYHGLTDMEARYRQRYLDLIMNDESRDVLRKRSTIIKEIRQYLDDKGYMEVETPMLNTIPGGANAKPFVTHHNALDMDQYLRIAPELYLKRLVVGGFERVFELNRCFRNEGIDTRHNPEFTTIEFYATYWTYEDQMRYTESLLRYVAKEATGSEKFNYQGTEIDLSKPFARLTPQEAILKYAPQYKPEQLKDEAFLRSELEKLGAKQPDWVGLGALVMALFEEVAESRLIEPTFIVDYPIEISPLARASDTKPGLTERFELFIYGRETANGFSELNDPDDQAARFKAQADAKSKGDDEAMYYDADFIRALEYGMPPTGGCGIGIDRFVMLLTNASSIREVLLFPTLRPEKE